MPHAYQPRPCRCCGKPKGDKRPGYAHNWYCTPCAAAKADANRRARSVCGSCPTGVWPRDCLACRRLRKQAQYEAARRGAEKRRRSDSGYFRPENAERYWQQRAHAAVRSAIKRGLLPDLKSREYACADCAAVAHEYDHRDYGRPLDVQPVCRSCNKRRGTAIWPSASQYNFARATAQVSATS